MVLAEWGYLRSTQQAVLRTVCEALLYIRSPHLDELTIEHLHTEVARHPRRTGSYRKVAFSRVLASIGVVPGAIEIERLAEGFDCRPAVRGQDTSVAIAP